MFLRLAIIVLLMTCAGKAQTLVQQNSSCCGQPSSTAFSSNITSGNLLVVATSGWNGASPNTPTDTRGTVYNRIGYGGNNAIGDGQAGCGSDGHIFYWVGIAPSSGADTVTTSNMNNGNTMAYVSEWSGVTEVSWMGSNCLNTVTSIAVTNQHMLATSVAGVVIVGAVNTQKNTTFTCTTCTIRQQTAFGTGASGMFGDASVTRQTTMKALSYTVASGLSGNHVVALLWLGGAVSGGGTVLALPNRGSAQ